MSTSECLSEELYSTTCSVKNRRNKGLCASAGIVLLGCGIACTTGVLQITGRNLRFSDPDICWRGDTVWKTIQDGIKDNIPAQLNWKSKSEDTLLDLILRKSQSGMWRSRAALAVMIMGWQSSGSWAEETRQKAAESQPWFRDVLGRISQDTALERRGVQQSWLILLQAQKWTNPTSRISSRGGRRWAWMKNRLFTKL